MVIALNLPLYIVDVFAEFLGLNEDDMDYDCPLQDVSTGVNFFMIPITTREASRE